MTVVFSDLSGSTAMGETLEAESLRRVLEVGLLLGDVKADMDLIRAFYADKGGVKPRNKTLPRLRDEESPMTAHDVAEVAT